MALRYVRVPGAKFTHGRPLVFPESRLAHAHCRGTGVELGAAAHNPFGLAGCINVAPRDGNVEFYRQSQVGMCGAYVEIDCWGTADAIPVPDHSLDYVVSSHVIEHCADPIAAFLEWNRALRPGGTVFMIFPKRDALEEDRTRPVSTVAEIVVAHTDPEAASRIRQEADGGEQGHCFVYTLGLMLDVIVYANHKFGLCWKVVDSLETDDKVGNGHVVVARYCPPGFAGEGCHG